MKKYLLLVALVFLEATVQAQTAQVDSKKLKSLILQDVRQQGLDKLAEVQAAVQTAQELIWVKAWEQSALKAKPITQEQKDAAYKELVTLLGTTEYRFLHVVVKNQDHAKTIIDSMRARSDWDQIDFKSLVNADPNFKSQKTDWVNMTMLMPEFRPFVKGMKIGEVNPNPVKEQDSWHIIGLLETRPLISPAYDQIKQNVEKLAEQKVIGEKMKSLLNKK
jgi:parvulin-like peptidyl-prolyl isomerase